MQTGIGTFRGFLRGMFRGMGGGTPVGGGSPGLIGNSSIGSHLIGQGFDNGSTVVFHYYFTTTTPGTIGYIHVYLANIGIGNKVNAGIYTDAAPPVKLRDGTAVTSTGTSAQWFHIPLDSTYDIAAATNYTLAVWSDDTNYTIYATDGASGDVLCYGDESVTDVNTMPSTISDNDWDSYRILSIYGDNSAS